MLVPLQLDERPISFKYRYEHWKKTTVNESQTTFVAKCAKNGIIGFINGSNGRNDKFVETKETKIAGKQVIEPCYIWMDLQLGPMKK